MSLRALGLAVLLAVSPATASSAPPGWWIEAAPVEAETSLRAALAKGRGFGGPQASVDALRAVSAAHPGTATSGLAQLAAGYILVEANRFAEAAPYLRHPDIPRTALLEHGLWALARVQEETGDLVGAGSTYADAAAARPDGPLACGSLLSAAEAFTRGNAFDRASAASTRADQTCTGERARVLLQTARIHDGRRDLRAAAEAYDRLDREYPASPEAGEAAPRLAALASYLPPTTPQDRNDRDLKKTAALFEAGRLKESLPLLRALATRTLTPEDRDVVHVRLGRAALAAGRSQEAAQVLARVPATSPVAAEAAFHLAKIRSSRGGAVNAYESVFTSFPGAPWGEEALLALANFYQKDARDEEALPYYRRLLQAYPDGRYADRATWRVAWADYRAGRFEEAAQALEKAARLRSSQLTTAGYLYWAGRARRELGQVERARQLLDEVVRRFKYAYYGSRAREVLAQFPASPAVPPTIMRAPSPLAGPDIPAPQAERVRQLLLIDRFDQAVDELRMLSGAAAQATIAWIEAQRGRLRPAITAMKRAYPGYVGEAGDLLPPEVWRILYPLEFGDLLRAKAGEEGLDPALVAAIICQESTFDAGAVSRAGARGLMQVIPATGRLLARDLGLPFRRTALHNPETSLDFGTRYLRQMLDRFGGREERALAAYNAGPHRVDAWTAARPDIPAEEFIESIPFTETRNYVMIILGAREQYRRLYSLTTAVASGGGGAPRP